ncbi:MAG TPA: hypothetical protein VGS41_02575, partial [Chthonomonadales bacterium]|nr:hypothetical protein [Chthonomonadales bacterium]
TAVTGTGGSGKEPLLLAVYMGHRDAAKRFAVQTGLDLKQTVVLADPALAATHLYRAAPCPRLFVLDEAGVLRYVNDHLDDSPQTAPAMAIASRVVDAIRFRHAAAPKLISAKPQQQGARLTVVQVNGVKSKGPGQGSCDFGSIIPAASRPLTRTVEVRNDTSSPVEIDHVEFACGCSSAAPGEAEKKVLLKPGKVAAYHFVLDLSHMYPGPVTKVISLIGAHGALATFEFSAEVRPQISFSPAVLDFGAVQAGVSRTLSLSVSVDMRNSGYGPAPQLVSSNPDISVQPDGQVLQQSAAGQTIAYQYKVTLGPHAPIGTVLGDLVLPGADAPNQGKARLAGNVTGSIAASPSAVVFGTVPIRHSAAMKVGITATDPSYLAHLKVSSPLTWLQAQIEPAQGKSLLVVTLKPRSRPGAVDTVLTVTAPDGERLMVPVLAYVSRRP